MKRFYVLVVFCCACFLQGLTWSVFGALPKAAKRLFPNLNDSAISWVLNANTITQICAVPLSVWLLKRKDGLRLSVNLLCVAVLLQQCCWGLSTLFPMAIRRSTEVQLAIYVGAAAGVSLGRWGKALPSFLSASWFPPESRGRVT